MSADQAVRFDAQRLRDWAFEPIRHRYTKRDTMLYALSLGAGCDPSDAQALRFCYELDLQALPTMAVVLAYPRLPMSPDMEVMCTNDPDCCSLNTLAAARLM